MDCPLFIGLDLAWRYTHKTGIALLRLDPDGIARLVQEPECVRSDADILDRVHPFVGDTLIIGIDAPLIVPNASGMRPAEAELGRVFRKYQAGAHPANRKLVSMEGTPDGIVRGEALITQLAALTIRHDAVIKPRAPTRQAFELYTHPAMIALFGLDRTLKYKRRGTSRTAAIRAAAFDEYRNHLITLRGATPALHIDSELMHMPVSELLRKDNEDRLDAVFCAYIALYYWFWGTEKCRVFGDMHGGYIVSPVDSRMLSTS